MLNPAHKNEAYGREMWRVNGVISNCYTIILELQIPFQGFEEDRINVSDSMAHLAKRRYMMRSEGKAKNTGCKWEIERDITFSAVRTASCC